MYVVFKDSKSGGRAGGAVFSITPIKSLLDSADMIWDNL